MARIADLEISLHRRENDYSIEARYHQPDTDAEIRLGQAQQITAQLDVAALQMKIADPMAYGKALCEALFSNEDLKIAFAKARTQAQTQNVPLRVRLVVGPSAPELQSLYWETLYSPEEDTPLFTGEQIFFSRYLSSLDWRPVTLKPRSELDALVAVANPSNLGDYSLTAMDVKGEMERVRLGLGGIPARLLPGDAKDHCTLDAIIEGLRNGTEILYLVAHGAMVKGQPWLFLEDEAGRVARVSGLDLVRRVQELAELPRLIVLASCQSAGKGTGEALQALGPRLAEAGVTAVVAMQGNVSTETIAKFMPVFFSELQKDGQIDRAMAVARGAVRTRSDYWMPVLFMRLKSGCLWYTPGFGEGGESFEKWPSLLTSIQSGHCTPIIGNGLLEPLVGPWSDIARQWAETYHFPLAPSLRDALPPVAQYLAVTQAPNFPHELLRNTLRDILQRRYGEYLSDELKKQQTSFDEMIEALGSRLLDTDACRGYKVMASLPVPIYFNTSYDTLLTCALRAAGKKPEVVICPWNEFIDQSQSVFEREPDYRPSPERPLVYHLFGLLSQPDSLVLTEDNYFDFLIGLTSNKALIPAVLRAALVNSALLFLGCEMASWSFRALFRVIAGLQGSGLRRRFAHVGVQLTPDESQSVDTNRARKYLENYFDDAAISIYWGRPEDFVAELVRRLASPAL